MRSTHVHRSTLKQLDSPSCHTSGDWGLNMVGVTAELPGPDSAGAHHGPLHRPRLLSQSTQADSSLAAAQVGCCLTAAHGCNGLPNIDQVHLQAQPLMCRSGKPSCVWWCTSCWRPQVRISGASWLPEGSTGNGAA